MTQIRNHKSKGVELILNESKTKKKTIDENNAIAMKTNAPLNA